MVRDIQAGRKMSEWQEAADFLLQSGLCDEIDIQAYEAQTTPQDRDAEVQLILRAVAKAAESRKQWLEAVLAGCEVHDTGAARAQPIPELQPWSPLRHRGSTA